MSGNGPNPPPGHGGPRALVALLLGLGLASCGDDGPATGGNSAPNLQQVVAIPAFVTRGGTVQLTALASDRDNDSLRYTWSATQGTLGQATADGRNRWTAPDAAGSYRIDVTVSDGEATDTGFVTVGVGSATLRVESEPPGASILLNGNFAGQVTPYEFTLVPEEYIVRLVGNDFVYTPGDTIITLAEGQSGIASFRIQPVTTEVVDTGPTAAEEIGGLTYAKNGLGLLYGARSGTQATLRSASLVPTHVGTNGRILLTGINWEESLALRTAGGSYELAFVLQDTVTIGRLVDTEQDGLIETLDTFRKFTDLVIRTYAPAFNPEGNRLAVATQPSTQPNGRDTMLVATYNGFILTNPALLSTGNGNSPSLGPLETAVYESAGELMAVSLPNPFPFDPIPLTNTGGRARRPAISPNGRLVAWLDTRGWLMLTTINDRVSVRLLEGINGSRLAWNPQGNEIALAEQSEAGTARIRLVTRLPLAR